MQTSAHQARSEMHDGCKRAEDELPQLLHYGVSLNEKRDYASEARALPRLALDLEVSRQLGTPRRFECC